MNSKKKSCVFFLAYVYRMSRTVPLSREAQRQALLADLKRQSANEARTLEVNRLYKQTGQPSRPTDTRTITEKVADTEGLKQLLRMELQRITDATSAAQIIQQLDDIQLRFAYEQFGGIERELAPRFKAGVPAQAFLTFLPRYIERYQQTGGVEPTVAEQVAPLVEEVQASTVTRARGERTGAGGTFFVALSDEDLQKIGELGAGDVLSATETLSAWKLLKNEIARQLKKEDDLTQDQIDRRKAIYNRMLTTTPRANGGVGGRSAADIKSWIIEFPDEWSEIEGFMSAITGKGIRGRGLARSAIPSQMPKPKGIKHNVFADLGRYKIDCSKLEDNILSLRMACGATIGTLPSRSVSKREARFLKTIVGGGMPSFDDMSELNEDERRNMCGLMRKCKLNDIVKVPSPDKDKQTAEMERFEILKGQILAGNDSKELVKEFKVAMLKFVKEGRIPKREANEILYELMALGF